MKFTSTAELWEWEAVRRIITSPQESMEHRALQMQKETLNSQEHINFKLIYLISTLLQSSLIC